MDKYISGIDSDRFGFKVAKINDWGSNPKELLGSLGAKNIRLIITRIPADDIVTINCLEMSGFQIKDLQVTHKHKLENIPVDNRINSSGIRIRDALEKDVNSIENIAQQAFFDYGHYSKNSQLDKAKVNEIYKDWALRSFYDKNVADKFFVAATPDDEIAGFLTFKLYKTDTGMYAAGGIGAVSASFRNQGIFHILVQHGLMWGKELNLTWEEHNALVTNYPVGRVFSSLGFGIASSWVTMHKWVDIPASL